MRPPLSLHVPVSSEESQQRAGVGIPASFFTGVRERALLSFTSSVFGKAEIGDCILRATGLKPEEVVKDSIRINERQNIIVVSAPTLESAEKYSALKELRIGDKTYEGHRVHDGARRYIQGNNPRDTGLRYSRRHREKLSEREEPRHITRQENGSH
ncbi:hypothetical protein HPB49_020215 [Dermacentor silvarum]|uniref:Uncharacterized protein n=1 Tax=Dermacentor silvarum TaxID=543639 RepID=A0ACB8CZP1_DERSI|nr:hypothetical protein HPB49_020215 [Dermacentor silvarum]